ncbi:hypothetical protein CMI37_34680 [Candidatus Pacearchaeota archaeon]|nr:hypothetical protein [Candidatus Pacearchaeota archaeon]
MSIACDFDVPHAAIWCRECYRQELNGKMQRIAEAQLAETKRLADATELLAEVTEAGDDSTPKRAPKAAQPAAPSTKPNYKWNQ